MNNMHWRMFSKLSTAEELERYFADRHSTHGQYCHYTGEDCMKSIITNQEFWISSVEGFNDKNDTDQFKTNKKAYYSACFSTGEEENLALWFLYAGKKGARVNLTYSQLNKIINSSEYALYKLEKKENGHSKIDATYRKLVYQKDFTREIRDVLYRSEKNSKTTLRYNTMMNFGVAKDEFDKYQKQHKGFIKDNIWYYEKETRLLLKLKPHIVKELEADARYVIVMNFKNVKLSPIKIDFSPGVAQNQKQATEILNEMIDGTVIAAEKYKPNPSAFAGKIVKWP